MKKLLAGQGWGVIPGDSTTEPLLEADKGDGKKKLSRFAQAFAPVSTASAAGKDEQPWASLSATYCPPDLSVKTAPPLPASKQRKPATVSSAQAGLPVSRGAHHSDESPRASFTPHTPFQAPSAGAEPQIASTSNPASLLYAAHRQHSAHADDNYQQQARHQRTSFFTVPQQQPEASHRHNHHAAASQRPQRQAVLQQQQNDSSRQQQQQALRAADLTHGNGPSSSRSQSAEEHVTVMASRTGEGSKYRRTVSITPTASPHSSERSLQGMGNGDMGGRASQLGLARASDLAWRLGAQPPDRQPSLIPHLNAQPSLASTISARHLDALQIPSPTGQHAYQHSPHDISPYGQSPMWGAHDSGLASSSGRPLAFGGDNGAQQAMQNQLVPFHGMHHHPFAHNHSDLAAYHGVKRPLSPDNPYHLQPYTPGGIDRMHDAIQLWRASVKWIVLWLTLSVLTVMNSIALVLVLDSDVFALICALMFCWSGVMGIFGATRTLMGHCMARDDDHMQTLEGYSLRPVEILGFTTAALSGLAAAAHFVSEQIVTRDMHLPACDKGDTHCMEFYNMIIIMMVASTVLYGCHAVVSCVVTFKAYSVRSMAMSNAYLFSP